MSKFYSSAGFKNFTKNETFPITNKISQKELKKQKKTNKKDDSSDISLGITDDEFEKMMEENEPDYIVDKKVDSTHKLSSYQIPENFNSDKINLILEKGLEGDELVESIKSDLNPISGLDMIRGLVLKFDEPEHISWIIPNKYGLALKYLFENNESDQIICLLILENFAKSKGFVKVNYKNSKVYHIRLLFQLFLTYEIIDEHVFWEWQDYLENNTQYDEKTKNILVIQTTEFYIILKTVFDEQVDTYDNNPDNENNTDIINNPNRQQKSNNEQNNKNEIDSEPDSEDDKYIVPVEQDYNLDDL